MQHDSFAQPSAVWGLPNAGGLAADPNIIKQAVAGFRVMVGQVVEVRALKVPLQRRKPATICGWFDDLDKLSEAAMELDRKKPFGVYFTINPVNPDLLARGDNELIIDVESTTSDKDILYRAWLPLDVDPNRPTGISATDEQVEAARLRILEVEKWMQRRLGGVPVIRGFSGNGWHCCFRVDWPNNESITRSVRLLLGEAQDVFGDETVSVDATVANAGRIWKLYGSVARKGQEVTRLGRVHRLARLVASFDEPVRGNIVS